MSSSDFKFVFFANIFCYTEASVILITARDSRDENYYNELWRALPFALDDVHGFPLGHVSLASLYPPARQQWWCMPPTNCQSNSLATKRTMVYVSTYVYHFITPVERLKGAVPLSLTVSFWEITLHEQETTAPSK